jgi:hypothetical protein
MKTDSNTDQKSMPAEEVDSGGCAPMPGSLNFCGSASGTINQIALALRSFADAIEGVEKTEAPLPWFIKTEGYFISDFRVSANAEGHGRRAVAGTQDDG